MDPKDISHLIPARYRDSFPKLLISPVAYDELVEAGRKLDVENPNIVLAAVADSAASFATSDYFQTSEWFKRLPRHPFLACRIEQGSVVVQPVLVLETATGLLLSEKEVQLDPDYPDQRVLEETRVEYFPPMSGK